MYEDDSSSEGGPKSSFEVYRAEGDVLFKQGEYRKAINSYNTVIFNPPSRIHSVFTNVIHDIAPGHLPFICQY